MRTDDYVKWFDDLLERVPKPYITPDRVFPNGRTMKGSDYIHADQAAAWLTEAGHGIETVIREGERPRKMWQDKLTALGSANPTPHSMDQFRGIVEGVAQLLKGGRLTSLIDSVRAETLGDLLDQAEQLLRADCLVAAAGIAGGVLETHLKHLVDRHGIAPAGHGSIERYNQAIGQARNAGNSIYSVGDGKSVTAWGDIRNKADHEPLAFDRSKEGVSLMIQGIRDFLNRVP